MSLCRTLSQNYSLFIVWLEEFRRKTLQSRAAVAGSPQPLVHHKQPQHFHKLTQTAASPEQFTRAAPQEPFHVPGLKPVLWLGVWWGLRVQIWGQTWGMPKGINADIVNTFLQSLPGVIRVQSCSICVPTQCLWELNGVKWYGEAWKKHTKLLSLILRLCLDICASAHLGLDFRLPLYVGVRRLSLIKQFYVGL